MPCHRNQTQAFVIPTPERSEEGGTCCCVRCYKIVTGELELDLRDVAQFHNAFQKTLGHER